MARLFCRSFSKHAIPQLAVLGVVLAALSACSSTGGMKQSAAPAVVGREKALAFPPPGAAGIISVIERKYANAVAQDIILETATSMPGENYLKVQFFGPAASDFAGAERLSRAGFNPALIARDLRSEFPGIRMAMAGTYQQNGYGPFAYAYGVDERRGESCLYAWQQISSSEHARNGINDLGMIRTRLRLCEPDSSLASLLSVMHHYTLSGGFADPRWNPYGPPPEPDPRIGQVGKPIYSLPTTVEVAAPRATPVAAPRRAPRVEAARAEIAAPARSARSPMREALMPSSSVMTPSAVSPTVMIPAPRLPQPADAAAEARTVGIPSSGPALPAATTAGAPANPAPPAIPPAPCAATGAGCGGF